MFLRLLAAFIIVPLVELFLLLKLASWTSPGATFLLVLVTGIIGSALAKREGVLAWRKFHLAMAEGRVPGREIQDGVMIVLAAAFLLTPGLITDTVGFILLVPPGRAFVRKFVIGRYLNRMNFHVSSVQTDAPQPGSTPTQDDPMTVDAANVRRKSSS